MGKKIVAGVVALAVVAAAVVVGISIGKGNSNGNDGTRNSAEKTASSLPPQPTAAQTDSGSVTANGAASFVGRASNAILFIQWTRAGSSVTGQIQENFIQGDGEGVSPSSSSFTGTISSNGITLQLSQGLAGVSSLTGELVKSGFQLTFPGANAATPIEILFVPGSLSLFTAATNELNDEQYGSPCTLYLSDHEASATFTGPGAAGQCAAFVQNESSYGTWSTNPDVAEDDDGEITMVCKLQNEHRTRVTVDDGGDQTYGNDVCNDLNSDGQWVSVGDLQPASAVQSTSTTP